MQPLFCFQASFQASMLPIRTLRKTSTILIIRNFFRLLADGSWGLVSKFNTIRCNSVRWEVYMCLLCIERLAKSVEAMYIGGVAQYITAYVPLSCGAGTRGTGENECHNFGTRQSEPSNVTVYNVFYFIINGFSYKLSYTISN